MLKSKKVSRILSIMLVFTIALSVLSVTASAASFTTSTISAYGSKNVKSSISVGASKTVAVTVSSNSAKAPLEVWLQTSTGDIKGGIKTLYSGNCIGTVSMSPILSATTSLNLYIYNDSTSSTTVGGSYSIY